MPHEVNQRVNDKEVEYNQHFRIKYDVDDASHCRGSGACSAVEDAGAGARQGSSGRQGAVQMQHCTQYYDESSAAAPTFALTFRLVQAASKVRVRNQRGISEESARNQRGLRQEQLMANIWLILGGGPPLAWRSPTKIGTIFQFIPSVKLCRMPAQAAQRSPTAREFTANPAPLCRCRCRCLYAAAAATPPMKKLGTIVHL